MIPANYTIKAYKGDTFVQPITINRSGFDFTGWLVKIQIRSLDLSEVIYTSAPSIALPALGVCTFDFRIEATDMDLFEPGQYVYDIQLTKSLPSLIRDTYVRGQFKVLADITDYA